MAEPYRIKVHHLEVCNCNHGCGCQFGGFPDHGGCEALLGFQVIEGNYGAVDLAGTKVVVAVKWPAAIHEGNGTAAMFVDESVSEEQEQGLAMIFSGQAGGMPWEAIAGTITSLEGPLRRTIEMTVDGSNSSFGIAGVLDADMTPLADPMSGDDKDVHIVYPQGGFLWDDGSIGTTETMRIDFGGIQFDHPGMFAAYATPEWTNQA
jgi:hypothetical protein